MNFEDLHNDLEQFPEELNYSEEMWSGALSFIEAQEAAVKRKRVYAALSSAVVIILLALILPAKSNPTLAVYSPRNSEFNPFESEKEVTDLEVLNFRITDGDTPIRVDAVALELEQSPISANQRPLKDIQKNGISSEIEKQQKVVKSVYGSKIVESAVLDDKSFSQPRKMRGDLTPQSIEQEVDGMKFYQPTKEAVGLAAQSTLAPNMKIKMEPFEVALNSIGFRKSLLQSREKINSNLRSKEVKTSKALFTIYKEFIALKVGVNPWNDYGTVSSLRNYNPSVGLFYENIIRPNISWSIGAEYFSLSSFDSAVSSSQTSYNYSAESKITTVYTNKAHFASIPLSLGVRPFPRVQLKGGIAPGMLLETENTLEEHFSAHNKNELLSSSETNGYRGSFRAFQLAATVSANYWFSKRNSIQVTLHKGFTDFSKDDVFNNTNEDSTSRIEISLNRVIR